MVRRLMRIGLRKGLLEGSRGWFTLGAIAGVLRLLGRMTRKESEIVLREELPEGATMVITNRGAPAPK